MNRSNLLPEIENISFYNSSVVNTTENNAWHSVCSVCRDGGTMICCESPGCLRVFHIDHHIPPYNEVPR